MFDVGPLCWLFGAYYIEGSRILFHGSKCFHDNLREREKCSGPVMSDKKQKKSLSSLSLCTPLRRRSRRSQSQQSRVLLGAYAFVRRSVVSSDRLKSHIAFKLCSSVHITPRTRFGVDDLQRIQFRTLLASRIKHSTESNFLGRIFCCRGGHVGRGGLAEICTSTR